MRISNFVFTIAIIVACMTTGCRSPSQCYHRTHDVRSLFRVLYDEIRSGDSRSKVHALLGSGYPVWQKLYEYRERNGSAFPDGFQQGDEIFIYPAIGNDGEECSVLLHFRTDKLINYDFERFRVYKKSELISK